MQQTIYSVLCAARRHASNKVALMGIKRKFLTHNGLVQQIERIVDTLNQAGIGRGDRVAIALENGPDAAACCLAVAAAATAAPLNIGCTAPQFQEHFSALGPKALIVEDGSESAAIRVADEMGIPIFWLLAERHTPGGVFSLITGRRKRAENAGFAAPEDVAFLLHTSGSTSRPKMAPLTHLNVCAGAANNARHLQLTADDRCLCVTGMFYTQGLLVSVFSPLMMAGSTVCTPGYNPLNFFAWLDQFRPSWYAAPTTIQRSILGRAPLHPDIVAHSRLRVIRCSSAPADSDLISQIENLFRAPMLDSYGMTETSSTIAGEPLARGRRKPGSVGIAVGCEVAAVDERDVYLPAGEIGEIIVRGPSVIDAYEDEARTNQRSFLNGWLRTGDLGKIDRDGHLFLTGRIKELINRGGEKISPVEIDEAFNAHPAVAEAMAFALPDKSLGEEIAVAVVLRDGRVPSRQLERQLCEFAASRRTGRQPREIVFVREIPKAASGKSLRIGLAEKLGLAASVQPGKEDQPVSGSVRAKDAGLPSGMVEMLLLHMWEDLLGRRPVGTHENFFDLGGDSLLAAQLIIRIEETFHKEISVDILFEAPTVARLTVLLAESSSNGYNFGTSNVIAVRSSGCKPPLFILGLQPVFHPLICSLPTDIPVFGLSFPDPATLSLPFQMEEVASRHVEALRRFRPHGPYAFAGWCVDGILAYEMAQQLRAQREEVVLVAMMDAFHPVRRRERLWNAGLNRLRFHSDMLASLSFKSGSDYVAERSKALRLRLRRRIWRTLYRIHLATDRRVGDRLRVSDQILTAAASQYVPRTYDGRVVVFRAEIRPPGPEADPALGWCDVVPHLYVVDVPGNHRDIFRASNVGVMASALDEAFSCVLAPTGGRS